MSHHELPEADIIIVEGHPFQNVILMLSMEQRLGEYNSQQFLILMQKLLLSRKQKEEPPEYLDKLQPEKYGKGAYCELSYTPSKLADHILYKEANYLKKLEEELSKNRELEAANAKLTDQIDYLRKEKSGIESSLNKLITMYKGIMAEMQKKNEERVKNFQIKFKEELDKVIKDKAEEAKFVQSEKQLLEQHIKDLESEIENQKEELKRLNRNKSQVQKDLDELIIQHKHLLEKFNELSNRFQEKTEQAKQEYNKLKQQYMNAEVDWKDKLRESLHKKDLEIERIERAHKAELQKVENQRNTDHLLKNQEINQLTKTFQNQTNRMKEIITHKDRVIDELSVENHREKARVLTLTRDYETQITALSHQKNRLLEEIDLYAKDNESLIKQKALLTDDIEKENGKLRDLLYESSVELEKCKSELVTLARDNSRLLTRVKSSEEEAKTWRDSYYISKTRPS